jgi:putative alpha-1,2-mannosidase
MMYKFIIPFVFILILTSYNHTLPDNYLVDPVELVNPLMGSDSEFSLSNGNTYPAIALTFVMNLWVPQTNKMGNGWLYQYDAYKLRGFKQTHQPSEKASLGGKALTRSWLSHGELLQGGKIRFDMTSGPDKKLWSSPESYPVSVSARVK